MTEKSDRRGLHRALLYVGATSFATRLIYFVDHATSPSFGFPVLDELYYLTVARILAAAGNLAEINPGFRPLLYPWLLAGALKLSPEWGPVLMVVLQHLLGILTALGTALLAWRLTASAWIAGTAGVLFALAGPPLFFEGELLNTTLMTFVGVAICHALFGLSLKGDGSPEPRELLGWVGAGTLLGLAAQARPNALMLAASFPLAGVVALKAPPIRRLMGPAAALVGLVASLALFGWLQRAEFGQFQLVSGSGGINFHLGNKRGADGMIPRQGYPVAYGSTYRDSVQIYARQEYDKEVGSEAGQPTASQISRFWYQRAYDEIAADRGNWLRLMARKTWFLLWSREIPGNRSYDFVAREDSHLLRWLPVRFWMLVGLVPLGVLWAARRGRRDRLFWLICFILLWGLGIVLFFVTGRFRIPVWPALCVLAAAGGAFLVDLARRRRFANLAMSLVLVALLSLISSVNWLDAALPDDGRDLLFRSQALLERGELDRAEQDALRALDLAPEDPIVLFQVGTIALERDRPEEALELFGRALERKPVEPRIWNNGGVALERVGRVAEAYTAYLQAADLAPDYSPALVNASLLELRAGLLDRAAVHLEAAEAAGSDTVPGLCAQAFLARERGEAELAAKLLTEARSRNADLVDRLEAENRSPVSLESP